MMFIGKNYCANYKKLTNIIEKVKLENIKDGYEKYDIPTDTSNCDNCDEYPTLMVNRICYIYKRREVKMIRAQIDGKVVRVDSDGYAIYALPIKVYLQTDEGEPPVIDEDYPCVELNQEKGRVTIKVL